MTKTLNWFILNQQNLVQLFNQSSTKISDLITLCVYKNMFVVLLFYFKCQWFEVIWYDKVRDLILCLSESNAWPNLSEVVDRMKLFGWKRWMYSFLAELPAWACFDLYAMYSSVVCECVSALTCAIHCHTGTLRHCWTAPFYKLFNLYLILSAKINTYHPSNERSLLLPCTVYSIPTPKQIKTFHWTEIEIVACAWAVYNTIYVCVPLPHVQTL